MLLPQSTPESLFLHHAQMNLLPSHTYSNNSGGDPLCIPDLTVSACIMNLFLVFNMHNAWCKLLLMATFTVVNLVLAFKCAQRMVQAVADGIIYSKLVHVNQKLKSSHKVL